MPEDKMQIFIDCIVRYFKHTDEKAVSVGTPFLVENTSPEALDYSGVIGISGSYKGCVYFSAPKLMIKHLMMSTGEADVSDTNIVDMVGEVANTLSGNARLELGKEFVISVPSVIEGAPSEECLPQHQRSYVIPVTWKSYHSLVAICLNAV